jgi:hypothetical protein
VAKKMRAAKSVKFPSTLQVSLPVAAYDALEQLAEHEGSTLSHIGRRAVIGLLMQVGLYQPPGLRQKAQQAAVK